jgi:hypothetical protein
MRPRFAPFALAVLTGLATGAAHAVLGERLAVAPAAAASQPTQRMQALAAGVQVVQTPTGDGGFIREYVSASGIVFAVSWNTHFKPRLEGLLGRFHADYAAAASQALKTPGIHREAVLRSSDLVVQSSVRLNHFVGRAVVPSLTPAGFDASLAR